MRISINGQTLNFDGAGSISFKNGVFTVNNQVIDSNFGNSVKIVVEGPVQSIVCDGSVEVNNGQVGKVQCGGSCNVNGDILGNVNSGGSVHCDEIRGDVNSGGSIHCDRY